MRRRGSDPLGQILAQAGQLSAADLADLLAAQKLPLPLASLAYVLGCADEETLARALSRQRGVPAVVLERSVIALSVMDGLAPELALRHRVLPLSEDRRHLFVASDAPDRIGEVLREIEFIKGKLVVPHIALHVTLARTLRAVAQARARGEHAWHGDAAAPPGRPPPAAGSIFVVSEVGTPVPGSAEARAQVAVYEDVTKEVLLDEILAFDDESSMADGDIEVVESDSQVSFGPDSRAERTPLSELDGLVAAVARGTGSDRAVRSYEAEGLPSPVQDSGTAPLVSSSTAVKQIARPGSIEIIDLDGGKGQAYRPFRGPPARVLVVDDDFASRQLLVKELVPLGYQVVGAESGAEAIAHIRRDPPDALVLDIMLPEVDGFNVCRAIKCSRRYRQIAVLLMSAVIDSGRVTDEVLHEYGADGYFEKPVHLDRLKRRLQILLVARGVAEQPPGAGGSFEHAISLYRAGDLDGALAELRRGIANDPTSARHHFVLANLLHKKSLILEAIDEYEATLELKPDYFPALTRLAYLYYKQGFAAKAIETWHRSLPLCPDPALRKNIEVFMRKLIEDMSPAPP